MVDKNITPPMDLEAYVLEPTIPSDQRLVKPKEEKNPYRERRYSRYRSMRTSRNTLV